jgi:hypothetical protein
MDNGLAGALLIWLIVLVLMGLARGEDRAGGDAGTDNCANCYV